VGWQRNEFDASVVSIQVLGYVSGNCDQRAVGEGAAETARSGGEEGVVNSSGNGDG
jgi:hypothetical protein